MKTISAATRVLALFLGGCSTMEGLGQDIETLGGTIEDKAREAKD